MLTIALQEFRHLFINVRSVIISVLFILSSFYVSNTLKKINTGMISQYGSEGHALGVTINIFIFGYLFCAILSHDSISKELDNRTIRFLITRVSRSKVIIGKYFGILIFWLNILGICYLVIWITTGEFYLISMVRCILFMMPVISTYILISSLTKNTGLTLFTGVILSLLIPLCSVLAYFYILQPLDSRKFYEQIMIPINFISPYYYTILGGKFLLMNVGLALGYILLAIQIIKRKDL